MIYYKEECLKMAATDAAILLEDGYTANGTPVLVIRTVGGCGGYKSGGNSYWCVTFEKLLSDDCDGCIPTYILGFNTGKELNVQRLNEFIYKQHAYLPIEQKQMLVSDGIARLREAKK